MVPAAARAASITAAVTISTAPGVAVGTSIVAVAASIIAVVAPGIAVAVAVIAVAVVAMATTVVAAVVIAPIVSTTAAIVAVSATAVIAAAVPRAGADEDAADKVVRTVEAIWGAVVRVVVIVSVRANRSYADVAVTRADSNVKGNLSLCVACSEHENAE